MLDILAQRGPGRDDCPSKHVPAFLTRRLTRRWRLNRRWVASLMDPAWLAAARLPAAGEVDVTQGDRVVDLHGDGTDQDASEA